MLNKALAWLALGFSWKLLRPRHYIKSYKQSLDFGILNKLQTLYHNTIKLFEYLSTVYNLFLTKS